MIADMKNQEFLNKALSLLPTLKETKVEVAQTVEVYKGGIFALEIGIYRKSSRRSGMDADSFRRKSCRAF